MSYDRSDKSPKQNKTSKKQKADLIIANNVLGHVDDLNNFIKGVSILLNKNGIFVFEVPHGLEMIKNLDKYESVYAAAGHPFVVFGITFEDLTKITNGKVVSIVE